MRGRTLSARTAPRLDLDGVPRPLDLGPALTHRPGQLAVLGQAFPGLLGLEALPDALDYPPLGIVEVAGETVEDVAVQSLLDSLGEGGVAT
jgi:hypothetical protein